MPHTGSSVMSAQSLAELDALLDTGNRFGEFDGFGLGHPDEVGRRVAARIWVRCPGNRLKASITRATGAATPRGASDGGATGVIDRGGSGRNAAIGVGWIRLEA